MNGNATVADVSEAVDTCGIRPEVVALRDAKGTRSGGFQLATKDIGTPGIMLATYRDSPKDIRTLAYVERLTVSASLEEARTQQACLHRELGLKQ